MQQKRVLAVHDISCVGRCSLTVALPIISAAGLECSVLPTAVLSTHTGGFTGFTYRDLTCDISPIADHWKTLDLSFDSIYTGFLGSFEQLDLVSKLFDDFRSKNTLILVDPVMADNGQLYSIFPADFPEGMKKLVSKADVIVPNITEAALLLNEEYIESGYTKEYIFSLLKKLSDLGPNHVVLTGVSFDDSKLGAVCYTRGDNDFQVAMNDKIEGYYHGTGDVFGSVLVSSLLNGLSLMDSTKIAVDFTVNSILKTKGENVDIRYGVNFELCLPMLIEKFGLTWN